VQSVLSSTFEVVSLNTILVDPVMLRLNGTTNEFSLNSKKQFSIVHEIQFTQTVATVQTIANMNSSACLTF